VLVLEPAVHWQPTNRVGLRATADQFQAVAVWFVVDSKVRAAMVGREANWRGPPGCARRRIDVAVDVVVANVGEPGVIRWSRLLLVDAKVDAEARPHAIVIWLSSPILRLIQARVTLIDV
jgi:hypothetical protein